MKRVRIVTLGLIIALGAILGVIGMAGDVPAQAKTQKFTVGFDAEFPPYGYKDDNGEYVGFDLDLAQEVCKRNGWKLAKQPIEWNSKDMELNSGAIDCIWNGFTLNGKEDKYTWSTPYVDNSQLVVVRKKDKLKELSDLKDKIVVVQSDSSALAAFEGEDATEENKKLCASFKELQQVGDYNTAFMNLESGSVDAVCLDLGVANYQMETRGDIFEVLDTPVSTEQYAIGFKLGNTKLRDQVQKTLLEMLEDGSFKEIAKKWKLENSVCLSASDKVKDNIKNKKKETFLQKVKGITVQLAEGMLDTLIIFLGTLLFAMPLGLLVALGRMCKVAPIRGFVKLYISIMRGTPLMLQLLVVYFGPYYLLGVETPANYRLIAVLIGFSLNYAAYFAEIYRSGIQAVPVGQYEASFVLGYTKLQTFFRIILPQMIKNTLPSVTNEVITLVKDTSLAYAISYTEMFKLAKEVAASQRSVMPLFVAGVFYYIFNFLVAFVMERIEKKMDYFH